jgi:hypothetical protein
MNKGEAMDVYRIELEHEDDWKEWTGLETPQFDSHSAEEAARLRLLGAFADDFYTKEGCYLLQGPEGTIAISARSYVEVEAASPPAMPT